VSRSLEGRLILIQQVMAGALILAFAAFSVWISASGLERQESATLAQIASQIAASIAEEERETPDRNAAIADALGDHASNARFRVFDATGREIASGGVQGSANETRREARAAIPGGGWVVASLSTEPRRRAIRDLAGALFVTGIPLFLLASLLSRTIARRALQPLSRIASQAEELSWNGAVPSFYAEGDPAEVRSLSQAMDRLMSRLQAMLRAERSFTEDAAHELRTPVTVLRGEIEVAKQDPSAPLPVREALDRALEQARGMADLVDALLLLRLETDSSAPERRGELHQPVNLADLVRDIAWELREARPGRAADLEIEAEDEVLVAGHATLLASAIRNLVSNAFKFTSQGQRIRVSVARVGDRATLIVEDGGPGIAPEDRERVFDPFFRTAEARAGRPGFGLGLPILKRVARAHGGDIVLSQSALGGARFDLTLPSWEFVPAPIAG